MKQWDIFCRVIDNFGDIGVCWRLSRRLVALGHRVRLWVDDDRALQFMSPEGVGGIEVKPWRQPSEDEVPGDVVVESFGCEIPAGFVEAMTQRTPAPVWINLEYLSAEPYVERSHGLLSPQRNGLKKWFFYPGFTSATGGLLREPDVKTRVNQLSNFSDRKDWLAARGVRLAEHDRVMSLFCYEQAHLMSWFERWIPPSSEQGVTHVLLTPGFAQDQARTLREQCQIKWQDRLVLHDLPWLSQLQFDELLAVCDLNLVRGEDSLVRAIWSNRPFLWQIYPQDDGVHGTKLQAFLDLYLQNAPSVLVAPLTRLFHEWSQTRQLGALTTIWDVMDPWKAHAQVQSLAWEKLPELGDALVTFAHTRTKEV